MGSSEENVTVADGQIPVTVVNADSQAAERPALLCVPSIFGGNDDLLEQMASLADVATTAVMDPFWRVRAGAIPYSELDAAFARVGEMDRSKIGGDVEAVTRWLAERSNGQVVGLGICFGGPAVLLGMSTGTLAGAVTWHGSRMEQVLDRLNPEAMTGPIRMHFGDIDPITPPEVIQAINTRFAGCPDYEIVVHAGANHGFSHAGDAWDENAAAAGMADVRSVLEGFAG